MLSAIGDTDDEAVPTTRTRSILLFSGIGAKLLTVNRFGQAECIQIVASGLPYHRPGARFNWQRRDNEDSGFCGFSSGCGRGVGKRATGSKASHAGDSGRSASPQGHVPYLAEGRSGGAATGRHGLRCRREELPTQWPSDLRRHRRIEDETESRPGRVHVHHEVDTDDQRASRQEIESADETARAASQATSLIPFRASRGAGYVTANSGGLIGPPLCTSALA